MVLVWRSRFPPVLLEECKGESRLYSSMGSDFRKLVHTHVSIAFSVTDASVSPFCVFIIKPISSLSIFTALSLLGLNMNCFSMEIPNIFSSYVKLSRLSYGSVRLVAVPWPRS